MPAKFANIEDATEALNGITIQWLAGFFDGEGSIFTSGKSHCYGIRVSISQHDATLLTLVAIKFPGCSGPHPGVTRGRIHYKLEWCGRACIPVLEAIIPHLVLKKRQAILGLELAKGIREKGKNYNNYGLPKEVIERRVQIREEIMQLNSQNSGDKCLLV